MRAFSFQTERLKKWPAIGLLLMLLILVVLWFDSTIHLRRKIFLPGGDVGLGFRSTAGSLQWIEHASWQPSAPFDYVKWSVPYWVLVIAAAGFLAGYLFRKPNALERDALNAIES